MSQIISASRRTDIPALHAPWLLRRLRAGYAVVHNPMNRRQVERVSLARDAVTALVLWTRLPRPLLRHLDEIDERCGPPLWLVTLNAYPRALEPRVPASRVVVDDLHALAQRWGAARLHWRYDPIVLSSLTPAAWHEDNFGALAQQLRGAVEACHVSFVDRSYRKTARRFAALQRGGLLLEDPDLAARRDLAGRLARLAAAQGIALLTCCEHDVGQAADEPLPLFAGSPEPRPRAGACIDLDWVRRGTGLAALSLPRRPTRPQCLCVAAKDIGAYDTCSMGCAYCYATRSEAAGQQGRRALARHPDSDSMIPE